MASVGLPWAISEPSDLGVTGADCIGKAESPWSHRSQQASQGNLGQVPSAPLSNPQVCLLMKGESDAMISKEQGEGLANRAGHSGSMDMRAEGLPQPVPVSVLMSSNVPSFFHPTSIKTPCYSCSNNEAGGVWLPISCIQ